MRLIRHGKIVEDNFVRVADDTALPQDHPVIVSADRLLANTPELARRPAPVGVIWPNNRKLAELVPHLHKLALVALVFPKFRDGRAYSQARLLREQYGFRGELRATGQVLRDQFVFMMRAGFDALEATKDADAAVFGEVMRRYSVFYQPTGDGRTTVLRSRLARGAASSFERGAVELVQDHV